MDTESQGGIAMIRKIIEIDEEKCNGCGLCAKACHEGAIAIVNGKAKLMRDDYFNGADLLIAADCTAYAYGNFHHDFIRGKITLIGCPKLDAVDYAEKLTEIFRNNDIKSITLTRMTVPCCGGMEYAIKRAIEASGKDIPLEVAVISPNGSIVEIRK